MHNDAQIREQVSRKLLQSGINPTRQRVDIGLCLFARDMHISADQLLEQVNSAPNEVSKATVYNTLGLFAEKGLVREVVVNPGKVVYDTNTSNHHHIYNIDTGHLKDIHSHDIQLTKLPDLADGEQIDSVDIIVRVRNTRS